MNKKMQTKINSLVNRLKSPERNPVSVYRLQFNSSLTFREASKLVSYLKELGITDCYSSPYFKARHGSQHGYDVSDQNSLNSELGTWEDYLEFVNELKKQKMGQILDFVPNHMSIFDNSKWQDVLENGPSSIFAHYFDIDWNPVKPELCMKVLLPILEDLYGVVLERGQIKLVFDAGSFFIEYRDHRLPVGPKTVIPILESSLQYFEETSDKSRQDLSELQSIITACRNLPEQRVTIPDKMEERRREIEIIKRRLGELCHRSEHVKSSIDAIVKVTNGRVGVSASFENLHQLLEKQGYRLSFWRVAGEEINYRRFFDINELIALRMEDLSVYTETHKLIKELFADEFITGIRIDHVDGLFNPIDYLNRLQTDCQTAWLTKQLSHNFDISKIDPTTLAESIIQDINRLSENKPKELINPVYIVVEKILEEGEKISSDWPIAGTTGYEFMAATNQLFIDQKHKKHLQDIYRGFTNINTSFKDIMYDCKDLVMKTTMVGEVNLLAHQLNTISEKSWQYRDFTLNSLRDAIRETIACFPVYRTYINALKESITRKDLSIIHEATSEAKKRNPAVSSAIFDFIKDTLSLKYPPGMNNTGRDLQHLFVMRFQQLTGPVMAKGVEDTAFYIFNPLVSLNEVGSSPGLYGISIKDFHGQNLLRQKLHPGSFITTSSHDSKRSEDVRARINVLSEIPGDWKAALERWSKLNKSQKTKINGEIVPDRNEEYFLYQTLLGTFPLENMNSTNRKGYCKRIQDYMLKAIKEAKVHSSWINPNNDYEKATISFVERILNASKSKLFLGEFKSFNRITGVCGIYNSLSQVVLKIFSPGVPDIYQGNEIYCFRLTDPDNRQPIDFLYNIDLLHQLKKKAAKYKSSKLIKFLMENINDGQTKLYVTWKSLNYRKDNKDIFQGRYIPLSTGGTRKDCICAFAWQNKDKMLLVIVPRYMNLLTSKATVKPLGKEVWKDTFVRLPKTHSRLTFRNIYTEEILKHDKSIYNDLYLSEIFNSFPVAVLESADNLTDSR